MLPLHRVVPMIHHEDPLVVDLAMHHLQWVRRPERLTGHLVLEAVRQGLTDRARWLDDFTPSAAVLEFAIETIERARADADALWPSGVIDRAPDALFTGAVIDRLKPLRLPIDWLHAALRRRFELLDWPTERLRARFLEACAEANDTGSAMSEHAEIRALADRLVYRGDSGAWTCEQFERFSGGGEWTETWLAAMLVRSRQRRILDVAFERYLQTGFDENESLAEEFGSAFSELSEPQDVPRLARLLEGARAFHRLRLIDAISNLRFAEAEPLLLRVADESPDATEVTYAAIGLCEMLADSEPALARVADLTDRKAFDVQHCDLERLAIPLGIIIERPFPQTEQWRRRISDERGRAQERRELVRRRHPTLARLVELLDQLEHKEQEVRQQRQRSLGGQVVRAPDDPVETSIAPAVRGQRVGRNEPCPCGSGKKYKKCCLNNDAAVRSQV